MQWGATGHLETEYEVDDPDLDITSLNRAIPTMWAKSGAGRIVGAGGTGRWCRIYGRSRVIYSSDGATFVHRQIWFFLVRLLFIGHSTLNGKFNIFI